MGCIQPLSVEVEMAESLSEISEEFAVIKIIRK